jgi:peptidoglycan/LPS O-acetylase OafA/YrhL
MVSLVAWLGLPALLCAVAVGVGLLGERLARVKLSNALLAPLGACAAVCIVLPVYQLGGTFAVAGPLLCLCAAAGLVLGRRGLRKRLLPGWCALAGAATYAMYMAPVVLSGHWTWLGYNFVNDTANNMLFAAYLPDHGIARTDGPPSSATVMIDSAIGVH